MVGHMPLEHGTLVRVQASQPGFSALNWGPFRRRPSEGEGSKAGISFGYNGLYTEGYITHQDSRAWLTKQLSPPN